MKKINIDKDRLIDLYCNKQYSQKKCGDIFGCSQATICKKLLEYDIKSRTTKETSLSKCYIDITDEMG